MIVRAGAVINGPPNHHTFPSLRLLLPPAPIRSSGQAVKLEPEQAADPPAQFGNKNVLSLPHDLLWRILSFLSTGSIRNFIVSRSLRAVCEQALYRSMSLTNQPRRSIRLLETFILRPELALLVRHLAIDLSWAVPGVIPRSQVPSAIQPDGLAALSLAKNLRSFSLAGVGNIISASKLAKLREAISEMKLVRLELPTMFDSDALRGACVLRLPPNSDSEDSGDGDQNIEDRDLGNQNIRNEDLGDQIHKVLQAQPLLEEFKLADLFISATTVESLQTSLQDLDVPNLKSLRADTYIAVAFLRVAPRLESLNLMIADWKDSLLSKMEASSAAIKLSIRRFTIRVWYSDEWLWNNLAKVFSLFPNTEELSVSINYLTSSKPEKPANYFFRKIGDRIGVLPSLRHVDVIFETCHPKTPGIRKVEMESIQDFKIACPLLETVVDPERRLWTFRPDRQILAGLAAHLVGPLMEDPLEPGKDLPAPEEASTPEPRGHVMHLRSSPARKK